MHLPLGWRAVSGAKLFFEKAIPGLPQKWRNTPGSAQSSLLALCSRITPGTVRGAGCVQNKHLTRCALSLGLSPQTNGSSTAGAQTSATIPSTQCGDPHSGHSANHRKTSGILPGAEVVVQ